MKDLSNKKPKNEVEKLLELSGFSDKEIVIYLSLLELGKGTVTEISRKSGVGRTHCYVILGELVSKGLISVSGKEPKQEYISESPVKLKEYLEEKFLIQKETYEKIVEIIPDLVSIHKTGNRPRVRFYEGENGLKTVYEDTLTSKEDIYAFSTYENMHTVLPDYFPEYYKRRTEKNIFVYGITPRTPFSEIRQANDKKENRKLFLVPQPEFPIPTEIDVYDNKVMIASWLEKLGVIIESQEIADSIKSIFKLALVEAERLDKQKSSD